MGGEWVSAERDTSSTCFQRASRSAMRAQAERRAMIFAARAEPRAMIIRVNSGASGREDCKRQKAKGKRQKAKVKDESHAGRRLHFCLLIFASCLDRKSTRLNSSH